MKVLKIFFKGPKGHKSYRQVDLGAIIDFNKKEVRITTIANHQDNHIAFNKIDAIYYTEE